MKLKISILVIACIVSLTVGATGKVSRAEGLTASENLEILKKTNTCRGCDLSGLTLNRLNLAGADLEGADFSMAKFFLSSLAGANLRNANLKGASFGGTDLGKADLRGADLRGTSLDGAYLEGTLLDGEFITAKPYEEIGVTDVEKQVYIDDPGKPKKNPETREVKVAGPPPIADQEVKKTSAGKDADSVKKGAAGSTQERQPDAPVAKKIAYVQQAIVPEEVAAEPEKAAVVQEKNGENDNDAKQETSLNDGVAIEKSKRDNLTRLLEKKKCFGCDLSGLDLSRKNLKGVDLENTNLTDCNLEQATLDKANFKGAILQNAIMRKASLKNVDFYKADLSGADFTDADVQGAKFDSAQITSTVGLVLPASAKK